MTRVAQGREKFSSDSCPFRPGVLSKLQLKSSQKFTLKLDVKDVE